MMKQACRQTLKSLAAEWLFIIGQMSLTHFPDLGWWVGAQKVYFLLMNTATVFIPHPLSNLEIERGDSEKPRRSTKKEHWPM